MLTAKTRKLLLDPAIERSVSVVSLWEIALKVQIGKLVMPIDRTYYLRELAVLKARPLPVELRHSLAALELPMHHRDPFDRLLIAQAREESLTLVTRDKVFPAYDVQTVW
jgi:PIN domain nuclease of toxin-antitoxin system